MAARRLERIKTRIDEERRELKHSPSSYDVERIADLHKVFNSLNKLRDEVIRNVVHVGGNPLDDVAKLFDISSAEVYQIAHGKHASTRLVNVLTTHFVNLDETQYVATHEFRLMHTLGDRSIRAIKVDEATRGIIRTNRHSRKPPVELPQEKKVEIIKRILEAHEDGKCRFSCDVHPFPITQEEMDNIRSSLENS